MLSPFVSLPVKHLFANDYQEADTAFCALADQVHGEWHSQEIPATGPEREPLFIRHGWLGSTNAHKVLVLISGTHGVEGLAGSAIQRDLLTEILRSGWRPPADMALLLIHLLNPYGCAWARRCDQDGIDLNRNFIDFSQPVPENSGYAALREALLSGNETICQQAQTAYAKKHGQTALEIAVSGGQYLDAAGPWYGGTKPAFARCFLETLMRDRNLAGKRLAVIDLHTGLGPYGHGEIICDHPARSAGAETARRWYGEAVTLPDMGTSFSAPKLGLMDYGWHAIMGDDSCFVTLEFGTGSIQRLFQVLLNDHALHAKGPVHWPADDTRMVKEAMLRHFYPNDDSWHQSILFKARHVITQALTGIAHD
jgi:hypothetical protein